MPPQHDNWFARYQPWRPVAEPAFWVLVVLFQMVTNSLVSWADLRSTEPEAPYWRPLVWELTSNLVLLALLPALVAMHRRYPLPHAHWRRHVAAHLLGSLVFCVVHVAAMVALRKLVYAALGDRYDPGPWFDMLRYEYLKDARSYVLCMLALWTYQLFLLRLQGEARVLDAPEPAPGAPVPAAPEPPSRPERFLVRKLRREFLVVANDIEWLQAQGNYVGLRVNGHDYLLRSTLADFLEQLDPARFVRVHRSWAVNLDHVREIEPQDSGDARLHMRNGGIVPCSRRYRQALAPSARC